MTRQELIEHWATDVIPAVFAAENNIRPELKQILADNEDNKKKGAELYCHAIAAEIVSKLTDEQIAEI